MPSITKIKLQNFRKFRQLEINLKPEINTIIGDNESGKSTILQAIELVSSGSRHKVEAAGMESLLNKACIDDFNNGNRTIEKLPVLRVELYLSNAENPDLVGKNNTEDVHLSGLHMICEPNLELAGEINHALGQDDNFPYEHYTVRFMTFSGEPYSSYRRFVNCLAIDSSLINNEYANKEYIKKVYDSVVDYPQRVRLKNEYRQQKVAFRNENLNEVNGQIEDYDFAIRSGTKFNLETDLTLMQDQIPIDERGKGQQCFIKTNFALTRVTVR
ncbi:MULTISPECIES: AAA family ATPase [unclassified Alteromonas]|uniref:AAA family ATPase n=1 Tax=unclassified Alteromonas TaxID=2614992 RepID=UPI001EF259DE|nr:MULTISPECIES: AAA family ATPase [unclassified Alteromonas]MCG7639155.1 ATP-binding protein [Alteromonas sp. CNT1-28]MCG7813130.1 ATP-binding protein [Alteromonas sp. MCA-1]